MPKFPNVIFVHGSGQSGLSVNYLQVFLPECNLLTLEYAVQENPDDILERFDKEINESFGDEHYHIVAHSYGCLLSTLLADKTKRVLSMVAMSAPWGGSHAARWISMVFRQSKLFANVKPNSAFLRNIQNIQLDFPVANIITTGSNGSANDLAGLGSQHNDGLLTVETQKKLPTNFTYAESIELPLSHNEVLLSFDTINIIKQHIFGDTGGTEYFTE